MVCRPYIGVQNKMNLCSFPRDPFCTTPLKPHASCNIAMLHEAFPCNWQRNGVALQVARTIASCNMFLSQLVSRLFALQLVILRVSEKVEASSTFCNATRPVAACDTNHLFHLQLTAPVACNLFK